LLPKDHKLLPRDHKQLNWPSDIPIPTLITRKELPEENSLTKRRRVWYRDKGNRLYFPDERTEKPERKIVMLGTAQSSEFAPYDDGSWEIWMVGGRRRWTTRVDRWYEVHSLEGNGEAWVDAWREYVKHFDDGVQIWMHNLTSGFGDNVFQYPVDRIAKRFGTYFMTSSFSWMMAHAIDEVCPVDGPRVPAEIAIYGVDMEMGTEFTMQRDGMRHFIELARFSGIYVTRLASSGIVYEPTPYPMLIDDPLLNKLDIRHSEIIASMSDLKKTDRLNMSMLAENYAVIAALKKHKTGEEEIKRLEKESLALEDQAQTTAKNLLCAGVLDEEHQWLRDFIT